MKWNKTILQNTFFEGKNLFWMTKKPFWRIAGKKLTNISQPLIVEMDDLICPAGCTTRSALQDLRICIGDALKHGKPPQACSLWHSSKPVPKFFVTFDSKCERFSSLKHLYDKFSFANLVNLCICVCVKGS